MRQTPGIPQATRCPSCGNVEQGTACRFCGISKIPKPAIPFTAVPAEHGAVKVKFSGTLAGEKVTAIAVIAPADPEVGLPDPYPVSLQVFNDCGNPVPASYAEARSLCSTIAAQIF